MGPLPLLRRRVRPQGLALSGGTAWEQNRAHRVQRTLTLVRSRDAFEIWLVPPFQPFPFSQGKGISFGSRLISETPHAFS